MPHDGLGEFESAAALLRWANGDVKRLYYSVKRYFAGEPCEGVGEFDPKTGYHAYKIHFLKAPPETWRRLTFRVICDIRHCIDQAMFAAVHIVEGSAPDRDIYFPWAKCPVDLTHRRKKVSEQLWPTLDRLEPYPRGDGYSGGDDTIFAIRNLAGPNKHRVAVSPAARPTAMQMSGTGFGRVIIPKDGWDASKNEFTVMLVEHLPDPDYEFQVAVDIAFGQVEGLGGKPVLPVLNHFGRYAYFVINELLHDARKIAGL